MESALQSIWFFLWGLLWAVFFMTDGFDLGVGTLLPFLGKSDTDKRMMINSIGPLWDGNEVWLITAGGVTFAAFPTVYAFMFSSLYTPLLLILFALIIRGVSFEFRGKVESAAWKKLWDTCIFIGSVTPAILFGVAFANIFQGLPFDRSVIHGELIYHGDLISLLNPYGLLGGALFLMLFLVHGALWLTIRVSGELQERADSAANKLWFVLTVVAVLFLGTTYVFTPLYNNYLASPLLFIVPLITVCALFGIKFLLIKKSYIKAWLSSAVTIVSAIFFCIIGLYPNMFPSNVDSAYSLTAHNASASLLTLKIMLVVVLVFIPIVIGYQVWAYYMFSDRITIEDMASEEAY